MTDRGRVRLSPAQRKLLRALHRDVGYIAVGLTLVYALSGLALNHIQDWDPNFRQIKVEHRLAFSEAEQRADLRTDETATREIAQAVLTQLGIVEPPLDVYPVDAHHIDITLEQSTLYVDVLAGRVRREGQAERFLLRAANWLHLNRGKKAWTYIADAYAVALLTLATSGLFMISGRRGLLPRGALLATAGALVPILYVVLSGGP